MIPQKRLLSYPFRISLQSFLFGLFFQPHFFVYLFHLCGQTASDSVDTRQDMLRQFLRGQVRPVRQPLGGIAGNKAGGIGGSLNAISRPVSGCKGEAFTRSQNIGSRLREVGLLSCFVAGANRPKLKEMLDFAREGDTVHIHDFSRLACSTKDLLEIVETLNNKGIHLVSNKENIDTSTPTGRLMLTMTGAIAEFERQNLLDSQREGIAIAKRDGKYKGGKAKTVADFAEHYSRYKTREITKSALARQLGVSRPTLDRLIAEHEQKAGVI